MLLSRQPRACQGNVLWTGLWMIYVNTLVNRSTAVDECCCGKVDNRCDTGSCQVAGLPRSTGRYAVSTGACEAPLSLAMGGRDAVTAVSVAMRKSRCPLTQLPLATASRPVGMAGWSRRCAGPDWCLGVSPVRPPTTGNHCLKSLPVHRSVLFAGCPGQGGKHVASREFPGRIFHAPALE